MDVNDRSSAGPEWTDSASMAATLATVTGGNLTAQTSVNVEQQWREYENGPPGSYRA